MVAPDHKYIKISNLDNASLVNEPEDIRKAYNVLISKTETHKDIEEAYNIFKNNSYKVFIEALLYSDFNAKEISNILDIPESHIECYKNIFFDTSVFKNRLDKIEYFDLIRNKLDKALQDMSNISGGITEKDIIEAECVAGSVKIMAIYLKFGKRYVYYAVSGKDVSEDDVSNLIRMSVKEAIITATFNKVLKKDKDAKDWYRIASMLISSLKTVDSKDKSGDSGDPLDVVRLKLNNIQKQISDINIGDIVG